MRAWQLHSFGIEHLRLADVPEPQPRAGEVRISLRNLSLNYRDLLVIRGHYNPQFALPATPISDGAGVVDRVGEGVSGLAIGDHVMGHFVSGWIDGPFHAAHLTTTLGMPGPGMAAESVCLPASAVVPVPRNCDFAAAATLPIAGLTAWSALVNEGGLNPRGGNEGKWVLTLGTGGVSIFALQFAKALGAKLIITSSDDAKLARAREMGADATINYKTTPDWEKAVLSATGGIGADITVETGGAGTLERSLKATRHGGRIGMLGALTGLRAEITVGMILMKRLRICGIMVDCRSAFEAMNEFIEQHDVRPVVDRRFRFEELPQALRAMEAAAHFGKIVIDCV